MRKIGIKGLAVVVAALASLALCSASVYAEYNEQTKLYAAEFDGNDDSSLWVHVNSGGKDTALDVNTLVSDGALVTTNMSASYGHIKFDFTKKDPQYIMLKEKEKIVWQTRMKFETDSVVNDDGTIKWNDSKWMYLFGESTNYMGIVSIVNGKIGYGGTQTTPAYKSDYGIYPGKWYTITAYVNMKGKRMAVTVDDGEGNIFEGEEASLAYGLNFDLYSISLPRNLVPGITTYVDYVRLWDEGFKLTKTSVTDGSKGVFADTGFSAEFSGKVKAASLNYITVKDSEGNEVPKEITASETKADIFFPAGLKYDEEYTVTIPNTVVSEEGEAVDLTEITFTTEPAPFKTGSLTTSLNGDECVTELDVVNNGASDKDICILTVVYEENTVVKMVSEKITVTAGTEGTVKSTVDVTGITNPKVKAYLWNGLNIK